MKTYSKRIILFSTILFISDTLNVLSNARGNSSVQKYLISNEECNIPAFPTMSNNLQKMMISAKAINCSENIHLADFNSTHIWIMEESLDLYNVFNTNDFYCCYRKFYAETNIAQIKYGPCVEFKTVIKARHQFIRVECFHLDSRIYDDFFVFPIVTRAKILNSSLPDFNVLMFGIESMSRMNFLRTMPRTSTLLQEKGSIQLLGYNKVGDNSFPNLFPLLLGKSYDQVKRTCIQENVIDSNKCIFVWSIFKAVGYRTALASDSIAGLLGTYEYSLTELPTDFYLQPFIFETRNIFKNIYYNFHQCLRNRYFYKLLLNWSADVLKSSNRKLFGLFWEESISHENLVVAPSMDEYYYNFLKQLETLKHLDDSIVILFSDHGMRWGKLAQTEQGRVENRLPLFEILFPTQFKYRYPLAYKNFKQNRNRLTSPFDVHETLLDIVNQKLEDKEIKERSKNIAQDTKHLSLFLPIPAQRRCETIGIEEHYCTCQKTENAILGVKDTILAANYLINHINKLIRQYPQCHQLNVQKILNAKIAKEPKTKNVTYDHYGITLQTFPGGGIFDATIRVRNQKLSISGTVSRLNLYRHTSQCIQDGDVKMYCTCQNV